MLFCDEVNAEMSSCWLVAGGEQVAERAAVTRCGLTMKELYAGCLAEWRRPRAHSCFPGQSRINPELQCCFESLPSLQCYSLLTSPGSTHHDMGGISNPSSLCFPVVRLFLALSRFFITGSLRELRKINTHYVILSGRQEGNVGRG